MIAKNRKVTRRRAKQVILAALEKTKSVNVVRLGKLDGGIAASLIDTGRLERTEVHQDYKITPKGVVWLLNLKPERYYVLNKLV